MAKIFVIFVLLLQVIGFYKANAAAAAKITNYKVQNALLDIWKAPKEMLDKCPYYVSGFDIEGRPVFIFEFGKCPVRYFVEKRGEDLKNFDKYVKKFFRRVEIGSVTFFNASDIGATDSAFIMDFEGFSMTQLIHGPTMQFILNQFTAFQRIQDTLAYGFYVNVDSVASHFLNLAKPILGSVLERIEIYGSQKSIWIPKLLRKIDANQLPPWYGGVSNDKFKPVAVYG